MLTRYPYVMSAVATAFACGGITEFHNFVGTKLRSHSASLDTRPNDNFPSLVLTRLIIQQAFYDHGYRYPVTVTNSMTIPDIAILDNKSSLQSRLTTGDSKNTYFLLNTGKKEEQSVRWPLYYVSDDNLITKYYVKIKDPEGNVPTSLTKPVTNVIKDTLLLAVNNEADTNMTVINSFFARESVIRLSGRMIQNSSPILYAAACHEYRHAEKYHALTNASITGFLTASFSGALAKSCRYFFPRAVLAPTTIHVIPICCAISFIFVGRALPFVQQLLERDADTAYARKDNTAASLISFFEKEKDCVQKSRTLFQKLSATHPSFDERISYLKKLDTHQPSRLFTSSLFQKVENYKNENYPDEPLIITISNKPTPSQ